MVNPVSTAQWPPAPEPPQPLDPEAAPSLPMVYVSERPKWQYKVLVQTVGQDEPSEHTLNRLGADGWELTGVVGHAANLRFFFKRLCA